MQLSIQQILEYLEASDPAPLFAEADRLRRRQFGEDVYLRGIIEFSNHCCQNCLYCGLRAGNPNIPRYRLTRAEVLKCADQIAASGIRTIVLQGGEDPDFSDEWIADMIRAIKMRHDLAITLSVGERPRRILENWRDAGADRYLLRIETFDRELYRKLRPGREWKDRRKCIENLRELGYEVGSGFMVGLPGESLQSLAHSIQALTEMQLDMIGLGPFVAHPQTPLRDENSGSLDRALQTLALVRLLNPLTNMPSTSALESVQAGGRKRGLQVGANVIMPSFTPDRVRELYNIYPGKNVLEESDEDGLESVLRIVHSAGYRVSYARGDSPKYQQPVSQEIEE